MKSLFSSLLLLLFVAGVSQAQMTERTSDTSIYKLGNRPTKGTKVLAVGLALNDTTFTNFKIGGQGVLILGKYFISERTALRGAFRFNKDARVSKGLEIDTSITNISGQIAQDLKKSVREYAIMPGIERHFKYTNIFDIYYGADLILGFRRNVWMENKDFTAGVYSHEKRTTPETLLGMNGMIGLNFFVADLPLSIGLEYNFASVWSFGGKTHVVRETRDVSGVVNTDDYYTEDKDAFDNPDPFAYNKLKRRGVVSNDSFRFLLNFYIN